MSAIRMKALVQGRAGCKSAENEHQHNGERRRHGFRSPAKTQTDMDLTHGLAKRQPQARLECKRRKSGCPSRPTPVHGVAQVEWHNGELFPKNTGVGLEKRLNKDWQICGAGRKPRKRPTPVVGMKLNGKSRLNS
jgi:hypothetical protein